jgi:5-methyltetrahydrofolate--homocysteine methyltransferase
MKAMIEATFEFGKYPIELEEGKVKGKIWTFRGKPKVAIQQEEVSDLDVDGYAAALLSGKPDSVATLFQEDMKKGISASQILSKGLVPAMTAIGQKFQRGEIYIPEMMIAAKTMSTIIERFKGDLVSATQEARGKVVIGTVKGDLHDIGKNLVSMMLEGQGFVVKDLGVSVSPEKFVEAVRQERPQILAMSALLTTTMIEMKNVIEALKEAGLRGEVKVIVGGAPVTQNFADQIGADGYAYDAPGAAQKCKELVGSA